jgi:putative DNA primase/helicase
MVNIAGEVSNQDLKDTTTFKQLTGRSIVSAKRKFLNALTFVNYAKFIFACNELPMVYDNSRGFWDRWVVLEFPYTFIPLSEYERAENKTNLKIRDENIIEKISTPNEMSGFLNKCLNALDRINNLRTFSTTKGSEEIKNLWIRKSNSFLGFCADHIEDNYDSFITKKELRKRYIDYCKSHKINVRSEFVMKKTLNEMYGISDERKETFGGMWEYVWSGIRWKK